MTEPIWIDEKEALLLHERLLQLDRGPEGVRDPALLQSALARPRQVLAYADLPDYMTLAAAYTAGIVRNHPFADGNKRTGFLLGILFLELNRYRFDADESDAARAVVSLAARELDEAGYARFLWNHATFVENSQVV